MTKLPIRWLEPHEFPQAERWLTIYTRRCDGRSHFLERYRHVEKPRSAAQAGSDPSASAKAFDLLHPA